MPIIAGLDNMSDAEATVTNEQAELNSKSLSEIDLEIDSEVKTRMQVSRYPNSLHLSQSQSGIEWHCMHELLLCMYIHLYTSCMHKLITK